MCLCGDVTVCPNRTDIHIVQHHRERKHAFGTVPILRLALSRVAVHVLQPSLDGTVSAPDPFPRAAGVLYPGPGAIDLEALDDDQRPAALVVIDGTWSQAHRMYRDSPWLRSLKCYRLNPAAPSRYRIRKEPRDECLSTLESVAMALRAIEPETRGIDGLVDTFEIMVDRQLACIEEQSRKGPRQRKVRLRKSRAVPPCLSAEPQRIVVAYGETAQQVTRRDPRQRELAQWSAVRLSDHRIVFDAIVSPSVGMPEGHFLRELGWDDVVLERAEGIDSVQQRWREFCQQGDIVVAWNAGTLRLARHHRLTDGGLMLKGVYSNTTHDAIGALSDVVSREGVSLDELHGVVGRASRRLAQARAMALYLGEWGRRRGQSLENG